MEKVKLKPEISIIIPIYNIQEQYLLKCIDSIINQTFRNIEIIMINDGSEEQYLDKYINISKLDKRIVLINQANQGVSAARNIGLNLAKGSYITFVDADDWIDPDMCQKAYSIAKETDSEIVLWSNYREFNEKKIPIEIKVNKCVSIYNKDIKTEFNPYDMKLIGSVWGKLYLKSIIRDFRFNTNLSHGEDVEFNFKVFAHSKRMSFINKYLYHYRYSNQSAVRSFNENSVEIYNNTLVKIEEYLKENRIIQEDIQYKAFYNFICIVYIVLCNNYIFNNKNNMSFNKKMKLLRKLSTTRYFDEGLKKVDLKLIPFTRRMVILFAKIKLYYVVYIIIKVRQIQCKIYNKGE